MAFTRWMGSSVIATTASSARRPGASPAPAEVILESPHAAPMELQRHAFVLALTEILRQYRRIMSYADGI